jgi:hypothetical protein
VILPGPITTPGNARSSDPEKRATGAIRTGPDFPKELSNPKNLRSWFRASQPGGGRSASTTSSDCASGT